jgi:putative hydrolase of the HAD superfamily
MTVTAAITFDAGNTMLYCDPSPAEIYAGALTRHGRTVTADEVAPVFADAWAKLQTRTTPGIDRYSALPGGERAWWGAFLQEVLERLEHEADRDPLLDELYAEFARPEVWKAFPETAATLEAARRRGLRLAVVSNWDHRLPTILDTLGLTGWFDTVTVSSIEAVEKPAPAIFRRTLDRLGIDPAAAIHVGDSPLEDYEGSRGVGMMPVLIDRRGAFAFDGFRRISSLDQVLDLVAD